MTSGDADEFIPLSVTGVRLLKIGNVLVSPPHIRYICHAWSQVLAAVRCADNPSFGIESVAESASTEAAD
jgi:hypothetical protein